MAIAKKNTVSTDELFTINGLTIRKGATYKVENKFDATAPSGFQKQRTTKLPSADVGNTIQCPFHSTNNNGGGIYDTGLFENSPCYVGEPTAKVKERVKVLNDYVVKPFEATKGEEGILKQNSKFWDEYLVSLYAGQYFDTSNAEHVLALYVAMQAGELAPEHDLGNPKYRWADYVIIDKNKEKTVKTRKAVNNISAIGKFYVLHSENPQKLLHTLRYVGITSISDKTQSDTLQTMFQQWLDTNERNAEIFVDLLDKMETDKLVEETVYLHSNLKRAMDKNKGLTKNQAGDYIYQGIPLGKDVKTVALNLVNSQELSDVKAQILEEIE